MMGGFARPRLRLSACAPGREWPTPRCQYQEPVLVCAHVPRLVWWLKRRVARDDDPACQNQQRRAQGELDMINRNGEAALRHDLDDLDELGRLSRAKGGKP